MKRYFFLLAFITGNASAAVGLEFRNIGVPELAESVIKGVLKRDYVIAPDVLQIPSKVTLSVRSIEPDAVFKVLGDVLRGAGASVRESGGIVYVEKLNPAVEAPSPVPTPVQNPYLPYGQQPGFMGAQQNPLSYYSSGQAPKTVAFHKPIGKPLDFLASVAKVAGAFVPDVKGKGDVLVFAGDDETIERVKKILAEVDSKPQTLTVKAALLEFSTGDSSSRSLSLALSEIAKRFGMRIQLGSPGNNALSFTGANLSAVLGMIDGDRRFKYVAEPSLSVIDGEEARFTVGSDVPVRSSAVKDQGGNPVQSIEYRTAGVVITVAPKILDQSIRVRIAQQVSSFALTTTSGIDSPTILKREAETTVGVQDGELILIAGMDETRESDSTSSVPFLPSFLSSKERDKSRSQLLLMLEVSKARNQGI